MIKYLICTGFGGVLLAIMFIMIMQYGSKLEIPGQGLMIHASKIKICPIVFPILCCVGEPCICNIYAHTICEWAGLHAICT